MTNQIAYRGV